MNGTDVLQEFFLEASRNRSALLQKDFKSGWDFLGLNPLLLKSKEIENCKSWYEDVFCLNFINQILESSCSNEIFLHNESNLSDEDLTYALENLSLKQGYEWNTSNPFLSQNYSSNSLSTRMTLIHPSLLSSSRPKAFFRKLKAETIPLSNYEPANILFSLIKSKKNIIISGGTGSGKTTLLQNLISNCDDKEHLVIMEDTQELFPKGKNVTQFLSSRNNSLIDFCSYSLRISPDRIILGEMRGEEVLPLTLALNTGHSGFMTTVHSNSAPKALHRLKTLLDFFSPVQSSGFNLICQNIDAIIHMESKEIKEIIEVKGWDGTQPLFEYIFKKT